MEQIVLGRVGHYHDAGNGSCATALVVDVDQVDTGDGGGGDVVNVVAWHHGGEQIARTSVPVVAVVAGVEYHANSFHLTRDCPWAR